MQSHHGRLNGDRRAFYLAFAVFVLAVFAVAALAPARAYAKSYTMPQVDITAEVQSDGSLHVVEQRTFDFDGSFTAVWWTHGALPENGALQVNGVSIADLGESGSAESAELQSISETPFNLDWRTAGGPGDTSYSVEEIAAASGLDKKPNLYSFSSSEAVSSLMFYCPRITKAAISRTIPNKVVISVVEEEPSYYAEIYGDIYAVSDSLRVMGKIKAEDTAGLIRLRLQAVKSAVAGEKLQLVSERAQSFLEHATSYVAETSLKSKLTQMDLRSDFNTVMIAEDKFKLVFGTQEDFEIKVRLAVATLEDDMFKTGTKALINLQDTTKTSVIIDNQLEFD